MEQQQKNIKSIVIIIVVAVLIILPLLLFLTRKQNTLNSSTPSIHFVGKMTPNNAAFVQRMALNPLITSWTATAIGTITAINGSLITISKNNATLSFNTATTTQFFNGNAAPQPFTASDVKIGNTIQANLLIAQTPAKTMIPVAFSVIFLLPPPPPPPAKITTSPASKNP